MKERKTEFKEQGVRERVKEKEERNKNQPQTHARRHRSTDRQTDNEMTTGLKSAAYVIPLTHIFIDLSP